MDVGKIFPIPLEHLGGDLNKFFCIIKPQESKSFFRVGLMDVV